MNVRYLIFLCLTMFVMSCTHTPDEEVESSQREIRFIIKSPLSTRSGMEEFAVGDSIGIYAAKRTQAGIPAKPTQSGNQAHNAKWIKTEDGWQPASVKDKIVWSQDNEPLDFYAYYPYQRDESNPETVRVCVNSKQDSEDAIRKSDVLRAANNKGLNNGEVEIQFEHIFSMIEVKLTGSIISEDIPVKVSANEIMTELHLDLGTGELSPSATKNGHVELYCVDSTNMIYKGVLPVQQIEEGRAFLQCEFKDATYIYRSSPAIKLEPSVLQKFEIEVK